VGAACSPALAQRLPFERAIDVMPGATLDVTTIRGRIDVTTHDARQIRVDGTVTVRVAAGFTGSADPLVLAKRVADHPPIEAAGNVVRLRPPANADESRALTVSYQVRVPRDTTIVIGTDSGAVTVDGVKAPVTVTTESSAISLSRLEGKTEVKTGSGDVNVDRAAGGLRVVTQSSSITLRGLSGPLEARTQSGAVRASFAGGRFRRRRNRVERHPARRAVGPHDGAHAVRARRAWRCANRRLGRDDRLERDRRRLRAVREVHARGDEPHERRPRQGHHG
jgi:hypothetical protein